MKREYNPIKGCFIEQETFNLFA